MKLISNPKPSSELKKQVLFITLIMLTLLIGYSLKKPIQTGSPAKPVNIHFAE